MAADAAVLAIFGFIVIWLIIMALVVVSVVFWIWMIIDCAQRNMKDNDKVVWILILIFLGTIGAAIYYFVIKRSTKK